MKANSCLKPHRQFQSRQFLQFFLFVAFPVVLGASIYILFRSTNLLVFRWLEAIGLFDQTITVRVSLETFRPPDWILFSLPDGIWVYAITNWMILIWNGRPPLYWLLVGLVLGIGGEIGQAASIVQGTFQQLDIVFYGLGFGFASFNLDRIEQ